MSDKDLLSPQPLDDFATALMAQQHLKLEDYWANLRDILEDTGGDQAPTSSTAQSSNFAQESGQLHVDVAGEPQAVEDLTGVSDSSAGQSSTCQEITDATNRVEKRIPGKGMGSDTPTREFIWD